MISTVYAITLVCIGLVIAVFYYVFVNSKEADPDYQSIIKKWYGVRSKWFLFLLVLGLTVSVLTTTPFPTPDQKKEYSGDDYQNVTVDAHQWYWIMTPSTVKAGQPVEFKVSAADVNHGFGIYDEHMELVAQTQAMPGYTNKLIHTFDKPGKFKILCLEYCGLAHHAMITELTVE